MERDEMIALCGILVVLAIAAEPYVTQLNASMVSILHSLNNWVTYTIFALVLVIGYQTYSIRATNLTCDKRIKNIEESLDEKFKEGREREKLAYLLDQNLNDLNYYEASDYISSIYDEKKKAEHYCNELNVNLSRIKEKLPGLQEKARMDRLRNEEKELKKHIKEMKLEEQEKESTEGKKRDEILEELDYWGENHAFKKEFLTEKQIDALSKEDYLHVNEYCAFEKKVVPAMVDGSLGHSSTHVFLVWSVKRILEDHPDITSIREHLTRDADLTFKYRGKNFALEIETGTILKKKKQLEEKVKYLNRKYGKKWMFVVTKRDLVKKYKKFGLCTQRKNAQKDLKKLLKTYTQKFRVSRPVYIL